MERTHTTPAVIIPADRPATLGIARSLGRRGIPVYGIDQDPGEIGMASKYLTACPLPNADPSDENRLQFLIDLGKKLGEPAVLFPVSDNDVILCSRERGELQNYYTYVMPDHQTVTDLLTKDGLHRVAQACGIPHPQMISISCDSDVERIADGLRYPLIIKPVFSPSWLDPEIIEMLREGPLGGFPKVAVCQSAEELLETHRKIARYDPCMIFQEIIPGEDERLVYFCFYLDRQSRPLAIFAGRKERVLPVGFGSATYVRSFRDPELEKISYQLLSGIRYQGLGGVEFKKDPRDEQYKLIEFNARYGLWDSLSIRCGIDAPYIAYRDALGLPVDAQSDYREGVLWIDSQRDLRASMIYNRRGQLKFGDWLRSLRGEKDWAIYAPDDWKPALVALGILAKVVWTAIKSKFVSSIKS